MGDTPYRDDMPSGNNILNAIDQGTFTKNTFFARGLLFCLPGETRILPDKLILSGDNVVRGGCIQFSQGELRAIGENTIASAIGSRAIAIAIGSGAEANSTVAGAKAYAYHGATGIAYAPDAEVYQMNAESTIKGHPRAKLFAFNDELAQRDFVGNCSGES